MSDVEIRGHPAIIEISIPPQQAWLHGEETSPLQPCSIRRKRRVCPGIIADTSAMTDAI